MMCVALREARKSKEISGGDAHTSRGHCRRSTLDPYLAVPYGDMMMAGN